MKLLILSVIFTGLAIADPVFFGASGKVYHTKRDCAALRRSKQVYSADSKIADQHGMKAHECNRPKGAKKLDWAKLLTKVD